MPKRLKNADSRRFFDEFEGVRISRFRAMGVVDPSRPNAVIPFPNGKSKLINVYHRKMANGGGWSLFLCPGCNRRTPKLYLIDDAARCVKCCDAMNIKHRDRYGFTRADRRRARDRALDELRAKLLTEKPLRYKPAPASWGGKAQRVYNNWNLTNRMNRAMVALRLDQIILGQPNPETTWHAAGVRKLVPEVLRLTPQSAGETVNQALDQAQNTILNALDNENPAIRISAAKLMLRTKQARDRGFSPVQL